ncbi:zf-C3HC4 type zinc finger protein [Mycena galericulata]|nr:zf-C3HC4 type zinc finger protein [Mycena galericulata]
MGNSSSSGRPHDDSVDYGQLVPQGVYTGQRDWNQSITAQLIIARRLAPFYRPLEEYEDNWDDDRILAARKPLSDADADQQPPPPPTPTASSLKASKRPGTLKEPAKPEATVYRGAVECPICFLYYPPNINHSRCCDQAICTECFVQIKRSEPTTTHLVSEPAACPYCVQDNFGVVYSPPPWRAGIGSEGSNSSWSDSPKGSQQSIDTSGPYPTHKRRQKSFGADSPEVVLTDHIRPDWEAKLAAVRAAVTRRANRRIIMRQVGDRLIPVGVTSGRVHALSPEEAAQAAESSADGSGSRRSRRRQQPPPNGNFEQFVGMGGQELEELMIMEAMRLSLIDHEEQQRKEAEEKRKKGEAGNAAEESVSGGPGPGPSTLEARAETPAGTVLAPLAPSSSGSSPHTPSSLAVTSNSPTSSRSRSPSPNPLQALKDTASGWRRRRSSPPPFSTLSAALSTVSTASAVINGTGGEPIPSPTTTEPAAPAQPSAGDAEPAIPTITLAPSDTPNTLSISDSGVESAARPNPTHEESFTSMFSTNSSVGGPDTYDNLPSSPDSFVAHEPLLAVTPEAPATPKAAVEPADYFG